MGLSSGWLVDMVGLRGESYVWVPCFRGSLAGISRLQNHRESMWNIPDQEMSSSVGALRHAFTVRLHGFCPCTRAAKAWHPKSATPRLFSPGSSYPERPV